MLTPLSLLQLDFNRGVVIRSWTYKQVAPLLDDLGLKASTAYSCLINYLLRPKPAALAFIAQYTSLFALPENFVIGIQIRTGDLSMVRPLSPPLLALVRAPADSPPSRARSGPTTRTPSTRSRSTRSTSRAPRPSRARTRTRRRRSCTTSSPTRTCSSATRCAGSATASS